MLLDGSLNALHAAARPGKEEHQERRVDRESGERVDPDRGGARRRLDAGFLQEPTFSAIPPTLAGDTRLTNEEAPWHRTVAQNGTRTVTPPSSPMALRW